MNHIQVTKASPLTALETTETFAFQYIRSAATFVVSVSFDFTKGN